MSLGRTVGTFGVLLLSSCMLNGQSRVGLGQLYTSGNPTYDAYFRDVHQQQVDAATWADDKRGAHKLLVGSLDLAPDAPDVTIVQAAHESSSKVAKQPGSVRLETDGSNAHVIATGAAGDATLFHAIEDTAHQELERAKRLHAVEPKLDALAKTGTDLEAHVKTDFLKYGQTKANDVANELVASVDVITRLKAHAETEARESEDFVADLGRALETASEERAAHEPVRKKKKQHDKEEAAPPAKPSSEQAAAPAPRPAPPPKPAETGEVFTP